MHKYLSLQKKLTLIFGKHIFLLKKGKNMRRYWGKPKMYGQKQKSNNFFPLTGRGMGGGVFDRRPSVSPHNFFFPPPFLFVLFLSSKSPLYTISRGQGMLLLPIPLLMQKAISTIILCYNLNRWLLFSLYREI